MENIKKPKVVKTDAEGKPLGNAGPQTLWVRKEPWEKLQIIKKDIGGNWSRLIEIVCEQLLASGLVSAKAREEAREEVREITRSSGTELVDDSYWRNTFRTGEIWSEVAATVAPWWIIHATRNCEVCVSGRCRAVAKPPRAAGDGSRHLRSRWAIRPLWREWLPAPERGTETNQREAFGDTWREGDSGSVRRCPETPMGGMP